MAGKQDGERESTKRWWLMSTNFKI